jgi:hypothetical protein
VEKLDGESFTSSVTTPSSTMNTFTSSTVFRFLSTAKDEPSSLLPLLASRAPARTTRDGLVA